MRYAVIFFMVVGGCAHGTPGSAPSLGDIGTDTDQVSELPTVGRGTLSQDEISIRFMSGSIQLLITPLSETVIRTSTDATYRRLSGIARTHSSGRVPGESLFLVSVYSRESGASFAPDDLRLLSRGIVHRPLRVSPITSGWGEGWLTQRRPEAAVFVYPPGIDLESELTVLYADQRSDAWSRVLLRVQAERARIRVRGGTRPARTW